MDLLLVCLPSTEGYAAAGNVMLLVGTFALVLLGAIAGCALLVLRSRRSSESEPK